MQKLLISQTNSGKLITHYSSLIIQCMTSLNQQTLRRFNYYQTQFIRKRRPFNLIETPFCDRNYNKSQFLIEVQPPPYFFSLLFLSNPPCFEIFATPVLQIKLSCKLPLQTIFFNGTFFLFNLKLKVKQLILDVLILTCVLYTFPLKAAISKLLEIS